MLIIFSLSLCLSVSAQKKDNPTVNIPLPKIDENVPSGWSKGGNNPGDYIIGMDKSESTKGNSSAFIKSKPGTPDGFCTLDQILAADNYRGERVRLSGFVKAKFIAGWAGLWMRVQNRNGRDLSFDNMEKRPIIGTSDWIKYEVVLDVPVYSDFISFGVLLNGKGQVWVDNLKLETVGIDVPVTDQIKEKNYQDRVSPKNLDFEESMTR